MIGCIALHEGIGTHAVDGQELTQDHEYGDRQRNVGNVEQEGKPDDNDLKCAGNDNPWGKPVNDPTCHGCRQYGGDSKPGEQQSQCGGGKVELLP